MWVLCKNVLVAELKRKTRTEEKNPSPAPNRTADVTVSVVWRSVFPRGLFNELARIKDLSCGMPLANEELGSHPGGLVGLLVTQEPSLGLQPWDCLETLQTQTQLG